MENLKEIMHVEELRTIRSKAGNEIIGLVIGHLGENPLRSTILAFPDAAFLEDPFWWCGGGKTERGTVYSRQAEEATIGSLFFSRHHAIEVELSYDGGHRAESLKILSAKGVAFFSEHEGVVPKWVQSTKKVK